MLSREFFKEKKVKLKIRSIINKLDFLLFQNHVIWVHQFFASLSNEKGVYPLHALGLLVVICLTSVCSPSIAS